MQNLIAIGLGGALGAMLRYGIGVATAAFLPLPNGFPLGTFIANMLGAFLMGVLFHTFQQWAGHSETFRLLLTTGLLGALTTFSTFALESVNLYRLGHTGMAISYVVASNIAGMTLLFLGIWLADSVLR